MQQLFKLILAGMMLLAAGCATSAGNYQPSYEPYSYNRNSPNYVPPSFYDYNTQLQDWYTPPYWNPDRD